MTSLDDCCLQTIRKSLLKGGAPNLLKFWVDTSKQRLGETEHGTLNDELRREIIGYAIVKYIHMHDGFVYGGFVASHFSGRAWNDIDICYPTLNIKQLMKQLARFLCFLFDIHNKDMDIVFHRKSSYGVSMKLFCYEYIVINIDISAKICTHSLPFSVGSCLTLTASGVYFREELCETIEVGRWKLDDLIDMLRASADIKIAPQWPSSPTLSIYYWSRVHKKESQGWTFLKMTREEPPEPLESSSVV